MAWMSIPFSRQRNGHHSQAKGNGHHSRANGNGHSPLHGADCPVVRLLPANLRKPATETPHLMEYLHVKVGDEMGVPQYVDRLSRKMKDNKEPNVIYPVGAGLFIHIYLDSRAGIVFYVAIVPGMMQDLDSLVERVDRHLVDFVHEMEEAATPEEKTEAILQTLDRIVVVSEAGAMKWRTGLNRERIPISREEHVALQYVTVRDKVGMGVLDPMLRDPNIEDISCSGLGPLFVEHKIFDTCQSDIGFETHEELDRFVVQLSEKIGKPITYREPIVDATLPDGSRINIVFGKDVSRRGSNFSIRKFSDTPLSILELVDFGSLTIEMVAYLSLVLGHGQNVFVAGETASGKTTLMNALTTFIPFNAKIVSIEDTPELQVPHPNWVREVVRRSGKTGQRSDVDMFDLLKAALRQRPNEIIIGEIRGEEGAIAFQAMQTGHAVMSTFHAASVEKLVQRLTGDPINVPRTHIDNLNVVVIQSAVRLPDGKTGRRTVSINEIVGYDPSTQSFSFVEAFRWNPSTDHFEFKGYMNSYLLEQRVALARGIPPERRRDIYQEMDRRTRILERLSERGIKDFYDLYAILARANREGTFR